MNIYVGMTILFTILFSVPSALAQTEFCDNNAPMGCYNTEDILSSVSLLPPDEFGHYCAVQSSDKKPKITDADEDSSACACIRGTDWQIGLQHSNCCGDDPLDCGLIIEERRVGLVIDSQLCTFNAQLTGSWESAKDDNGGIHKMECSYTDFLSVDDEWVPCTKQEKHEIDNHQYICNGPAGKWHECCGTDLCHSLYGTELGQKIQIINTKPKILPEINTTGLVLFFPFHKIPDTSAEAGQDSEVMINYTVEIRSFSEYFDNRCDPGSSTCTSYEATVESDKTESLEPFNPTTGSGITIAFWISPNKTYNYLDSENKWFAKYIGTNNNHFGVFFDEKTGKIIAQAKLGNTVYETDSPNQLFANTWHLVLIRLTNSYIDLWVNGAERASKSHDIDISRLGPGLLNVIHNAHNGTSHMGGFIEEISVWNRSLKEKDILALLGAEPQQLYCDSGGTFVEDLDETDEETCTAAGFEWTGTLCCGEDDSEYYNDDEGFAGCWDSQTVLTADLVPTHPTIVNFDGEFFACDSSDETVLNLTANYTDTNLVTNMDMCFQDENKFYLCSENRTWVRTDGNDRSKLSISPNEFNVEPHLRFHCCAQTQCWNGSVCVDDQSTNPLAPNQHGYRCLGGEWKSNLLKTSPNKEHEGHCPDQNQCLLNPFGSEADNNNPEANPQCINHTQYIGNNYCEHGAWTSRTKLIALQLLELAQDDYILFCDQPQVVIRNIESYVESYDINHLFADLYQNHMCVLLMGDTAVIGTSFDFSILNDQRASDLWDLSECQDAEGDQYVECTSNGTILYNQELKALLLSNKDLHLGEPNLFEIFTRAIMKPIQAIISIFTESVDNQFAITSTQELTRFDKLFISDIQKRQIFGTVEGDTLETKLIVKYSNFKTDICYFVDTFNQQIQDPKSGINCLREENNTFVVSSRSTFESELNPEEIWNDLTSKLRLS